MLDDSIRPSPDAEAVLRRHGWSTERDVDISEWVRQLEDDGNQVFPLAEAIMRRYGGVSFRGRRPPRPTRHDFEIRPTYWYGERDRVEELERLLGAPVCPLGETSGFAMLAVVADGRVLSVLEGDVLLIGESWPAALDNCIFGRGEMYWLAEDYEPVFRRWGEEWERGGGG